MDGTSIRNSVSSSLLTQRSVLDWDEGDVHEYISVLGYPQLESQIRENSISGEVLCMMDPEQLRELGVATVGQRINILKNVYALKQQQGIPIDDDTWVPPSEAQERQGAEKVTVDKLYFMLKALERTVQAQQEEIRTLREIASVYQNPSASLSSSSVDQSTQHARGGSEDSPIQRNGSFKWATYPTRSPTKPDSSESPHPSPLRAEYDVSRSTPPVPTPPSSSQQTLVHPTSSGSSTTANTPGGRVDSGPPPRSGSRGENSSDNLKSFKVSLDDPTWKVLPAALKKYKINNDNWQNYAMFICYGAPNQRIERCLSYDEKPLLLFQKLKDGKKNPVFMLKHIKDIRSPIVVAQQKHAARKASNASSSILSPPATSPDQTRTVTNHNRVGSRPPRLEVHDLGGASLSLTGAGMPSAGPLTGQPQGWSDAVGSPSAEQGPSAAKGEVELLVPAIPGGSGMTPATGSTMANSSAGEGSMGPGGAALGTGSHARDTPITSSGVSYAVAIYPYMAEQEDEFDVMVGDSFVILSRARGWWVVQRDPNGTGQIDADTTKQGWVPAGCLLETNVPVASAIAEAKQALISEEGEPASPAHPRVGRTPILPLSIISTSFPGIALMDYQGKGDEELDLAKDDLLRVFKRYNHWSYAVKEDGGDRGWVPSWFIGKVQSAVPPTPSTVHPATTSNGATLGGGLDPDHAQSQISPMSSAFPVQSRSTTVV